MDTKALEDQIAFAEARLTDLRRAEHCARQLSYRKRKVAQGALVMTDTTKQGLQLVWHLGQDTNHLLHEARRRVSSGQSANEALLEQLAAAGVLDAPQAPPDPRCLSNAALAVAELRVLDWAVERNARGVALNARTLLAQLLQRWPQTTSPWCKRWRLRARLRPRFARTWLRRFTRSVGIRWGKLPARAPTSQADEAQKLEHYLQLAAHLRLRCPGAALVNVDETPVARAQARRLGWVARCASRRRAYERLGGSARTAT